MEKVTLILTYYNSPQMLQEQIKHWLTYPKDSIKVILIDDGSMVHPAEKELRNKEFKIPVELYRITEDIPQNIYGARNLGFHIALVENIKWVLISDTDHVLTFTKSQSFSSKHLSVSQYYVLDRLKVTPSGLEAIGYHGDSFLMTPDLFWKTGGYDEDLTGYYFQGAAFYFRKALTALSKRVEVCPQFDLHFYSSEMINDASPFKNIPKTIAPQQPKDKKPSVLNFNWERIL